MKEIEAYILAGGKSSRMGSDKGLLPYKGATFIEHIITALNKASINKITIISANKDYDFLEYNRITDIYPNKGPVGGIYTALENSKTKKNIILSVDIPLITAEILTWLIANTNENSPLTQVKIKNQTSPLFAVYGKQLLTTFHKHIKADELKLRSIIETIPHTTLQVPEKWYSLLDNFNTKEEYQKLLK